MKVYAATDVGSVRTLNEDSYYMPAGSQRFMAVADGMGGHAAGEVASQMAIRVLAEILSQEKAPSEDRLRYAYGRANREVYLESERDSSKHGMGTTMTSLWFSDDCVYMAHIGDSRAYRLRDGEIRRMSIDHSYVEELVRSGVITPEKALTHPKRNVITRCIGPWPRIETDIDKFDYLKSDIWLLCTDGLTRYIRDEEIRDILMQTKTLKDKVLTLVNTAVERGGADNITVLAVAGESETNG
ncbi:MAG: Stp1/IreP family PP2C-type Ser/Thr phosphatase [Clostridia bacterium]|nr:Stp1/IreP family PP2C-type Ser/Thr phosphatase [Clostridia bacterium]